MRKKRLLKDLPFGGLNTGVVLTKANGGYYVELGDTIYETGGSSHNGRNPLAGVECEIVNMIWDDESWFEYATIKHIDINVSIDNIVLKFKPLDLGQAQVLAKGIHHCIVLHLRDGSYSWNKFAGFTTCIR